MDTKVKITNELTTGKIIEKKVKFVNNCNFKIIFDFTVKGGEVKNHDLIGVLFKKSRENYENLSLDRLMLIQKLGHIKVNLDKYKKDKNYQKGNVSIPVNLDKIDASLLAASISLINKIGPYNVSFNVKTIEDNTVATKLKIFKLAKEIHINKFDTYDHDVIGDLRKELIRNSSKSELVQIVPGSWIGRDFKKSEEIYLVEGRADIIRLSSMGIRNTISCNGVNISKEFITSIKNKNKTLLLDGDRGGSMILKKLADMTKVEYVVFIPVNTSVETVNKKDLITAINNKKIFDKKIHIPK